MTTPSSITVPLQNTLRVLGLRSNIASAEVLGHALSTPWESIRVGALQTLIARGGDADMAVILEKIDFCNEAEIPYLMDQVPLLLAPIEAGLADRDPVKRQRSLCAIAKLQVASQFPHLVAAAENPDDPQQMVAAELLLSLASRFGLECRVPFARSIAQRRQFLEDLWQSIHRFHQHRMTQIVDAWLMTSHWDDLSFQSLFRSPSDPVHRLILRQLKGSSRELIRELCAGILWSKGASQESLTLLSERDDPAMAVKIAELANRLGVTPQVIKNLSNSPPLQELESYDFNSEENSLEDRCVLVQGLAHSNASPDIVLHAINALLSTKTAQADIACSASLRALRSLKTEMVVMVLSDCFQTPEQAFYQAPPWKTKLKNAIERLIELYPVQTATVRASIEFLFADFQCEELTKHLDNWAEPHLVAFARLVRIGDRQYASFLEREATSPSAVKRMRAMRAVRLIGMDYGLTDAVLQGLSDKDQDVRAEAIQAVAAGHDRTEAISLLYPLLKDDDAFVISTAKSALAKLGS